MAVAGGIFAAIAQQQLQKERESQQQQEQHGPLKSCLLLYRKPLAVNALCLGFLLVYSFLGGLVFLHFEHPHWERVRQRDQMDRVHCVQQAIQQLQQREPREALVGRIVRDCVMEQARDERMEWNLKNAVLFGFGILTTLGYGKIEPQTTHGRLFTVLYGFIGVPFTVIIFTNFGRYLQKLERAVRKHFRRKWCQRWRRGTNRRKSMAANAGAEGQLIASAAAIGRKRSWLLPPITVVDGDMDGGLGGAEDGAAARSVVQGAEEEEEDDDDEGEEEMISPLTLICIVFLYLLLGAALIDWLDEHVDFANGIYFAFLCLTAIEYGKLIPTDALYLPIVIAYICFGLAISTIALDIGSAYVKKLYYLGRKIRNIASVKIWFGAKHLRVRELLAALGHNIGLEPTVLCDLDLEQLISNAIQVKEGRMHRVPQTHMIMDGIWPPELVPLFLKDGTFPDWVDAEERRKWSMVSLLAARRRSQQRGGSTHSHRSLSITKKHSSSVASSQRSAAVTSLFMNQPPERTPPLPPQLPEKLSVRFEEFVRSDDEWLNEMRKWPPLHEETEPDTTTSGVISDPDLSALEGVYSSWSIAVPTAEDVYSGGGQQMRRSETVPPSGHPDASLFYMCTFPSMEMTEKRPPLPPLTPLPQEDEEEEQNNQ